MNRWYSRITLENEDDRRAVGILYALIVASITTYVVAILAGLYWGDRRLIIATAAGSVFQAVPFWLLRRGRMRAGSLVFVVGVLGTLTVTATFGQGIHDYAIIAYPIVIVFAGLTPPKAAFRYSVLLTLGAVGWLVFGEASGRFVSEPIEAPTWTDFIIVALILAVGAFAVQMLVTNMRRSLGLARQELAQRARAEEELQKQRTQLRTILESTGDGILAIDDCGKVIKANQRFADLWLIPPDVLREGSDEALLACVLDQLVDPDAFVEKVRALYVSAEVDSDTVLFKDGRILERYSCPLLEDGAIGGRVWSFRDITERKCAEETLRQSEEQLRQSQKMEAVGQLAGGIAHDFNNLLTAIIGYGDLLLDDPKLADSPAGEDVQEIKRAAERAAALTKQILAFSRRQTLRPTVVSLGEVIEGMEPLLRRTLGENIDLVSLKDPDLGLVEADVHQFERVIMNLAINARDAMLSGGRLTFETANIQLDEEFCRAHPGAQPGSYVTLAVSDTGIGMDEATRQRVFEPFFTTKAPGVGTGLGLATVYGIVKQSNGSIFVESELGRGTKVTVYMPQVAALVQRERQTVGDRASSGGRETILLVEDEVSLRSLVARVLGGLGYPVLSAGTAAEALQVAREADGPLDLLLTDVVLPGEMQGNDLARHLLASMPDLPVLYVSGYTRDAVLDAGRFDQGVNFLEKPFTPETLATKVRSVLDRRRDPA